MARPQAPTAAEDAYLHGDFSEAEALYRQALSKSSNDTGIVAGLTRSLLHQQKVSDAGAAVHSALTDTPPSAILLTALAEVQYRQGLIVESGQSAAAAYAADICYARVHLIRARLARLNSMYATEQRETTAAHALDPYDPDIRELWIGKLPLEQRISELKKYLAEAVGLDEQQRKDSQAYLDRLERISNEPRRRCRLTSPAISTKLSLASIFGEQLTTRSWALMTKLNGADAKLEVDSGASGLYISRKVAEKAGLHSVARNETYGFGDRGPQDGYIAYAESIRIGNLEFRDCLVDVSDRKDVGSADGLIGTDVFADFLVNISFPLHTMVLSPLPPRPGTVQAASLRTENEVPESGSNELSQLSDKDNSKLGDPTAVNPQAKQMAPGPKDRYIAPEMQDWFPVFRSGHFLLIPGLIDKNVVRLFIIDSGSEATILSEAAAGEIRRLHEAPEFQIRGLSGEVKHVYTGGTFQIRFADQNVSTREAAVMDISRFSNDVGVEISGVVGLPALKLMTIHIDYRDGLVKFDYDPTVVPDNR